MNIYPAARRRWVFTHTGKFTAVFSLLLLLIVSVAWRSPDSFRQAGPAKDGRVRSYAGIVDAAACAEIIRSSPPSRLRNHIQSFGSSPGPIFQDSCLRQILCLGDSAVSLSDLNPLVTGVEDSTSVFGSYHLALEQNVLSECGDSIWYEVHMYLFDGDSVVVLVPPTSLATDDSNRVVLAFDTRTSLSAILSAQGIPVNDPVNCDEVHRIVWIVNDGCGHTSLCTSLIRLEDCLMPVCGTLAEPIVYTLPIQCEFEMTASDLVPGALDDVTPRASMWVSFTPDGYVPARILRCEDHPAYGVPFGMQVWVADGGADRNCDGMIDWQERSIVACEAYVVLLPGNCFCEPDPNISLGGRVETYRGLPVRNVELKVDAPGFILPASKTDVKGEYSFSLPPTFDLTIRASRADDVLNGISTLDLVAINKHKLGIRLFTSPYQFAAADINNSGAVSILDMVALRKMILGMPAPFPEDESWRFYNRQYPADEGLEFLIRPEAQTIHLPAFVSPVGDADFIAVKVGDVNHSGSGQFSSDPPASSRSVMVWRVDDREVSTGERISVPVRSVDAHRLGGFQFTLLASGLEWQGVTPGLVALPDDHFHFNGKVMTASWFHLDGKDLRADETLFTLEFLATRNGRLSGMLEMNSTVTAAEYYTADEAVYDLELTFRTADPVGFQLLQNEPNPVRSDTRIRFWLPDAMDARLQFFDITGKVLHVREVAGRKGINEVQVAASELPDRGIVFYRLEAGTFSDTRAMILAE